MDATEAVFALSDEGVVSCGGGGGGTAVLAMNESRSFSWYTAARPGSRPEEDDGSPRPLRSAMGGN